MDTHHDNVHNVIDGHADSHHERTPFQFTLTETMTDSPQPSFVTVRLYVRVESGGVGKSKEKRLIISPSGPIIEPSAFISPISRTPPISIFPDITLHVRSDKALMDNVEHHIANDDDAWSAIADRIKLIDYDNTHRHYLVDVNLSTVSMVSLRSICQVFINADHGETAECHLPDMLV